MNLLPRLDRIAQLHRHRATGIAIALGAALLLLVITDIAGDMTWIGLLATIVAGIVLLSDSDSFAGLLLLGAMVLQWVTSGMAADSWWVIPAAWLLLIAHVAVAVVGAGPQQAPIPRAIPAQWMTRTLLVGVATTVVAAVALIIAPSSDQHLQYGAAVALGALVVAVLAMIPLTRGSDESA